MVVFRAALPGGVFPARTRETPYDLPYRVVGGFVGLRLDVQRSHVNVIADLPHIFLFSVGGF
jgi:hypothetical protein